MYGQTTSDTEAASQHALRAVAFLADLATSDPTNAGWKKDLDFVRARIAEVSDVTSAKEAVKIEPLIHRAAERRAWWDTLVDDRQLLVHGLIIFGTIAAVLALWWGCPPFPILISWLALLWLDDGRRRS